MYLLLLKIQTLLEEKGISTLRCLVWRQAKIQVVRIPVHLESNFLFLLHGLLLAKQRKI